MKRYWFDVLTIISWGYFFGEGAKLVSTESGPLFEISAVIVGTTLGICVSWQIRALIFKLRENVRSEK